MGFFSASRCVSQRACLLISRETAVDDKSKPIGLASIFGNVSRHFGRYGFVPVGFLPCSRLKSTRLGPEFRKAVNSGLCRCWNLCLQATKNDKKSYYVKRPEPMRCKKVM
jgi:hypothetical protein